MATLTFTRQLERYLDCPPRDIRADTVREALEQAFADNRRLRGYILDDQNRLRRNVAIFVDGCLIGDRLQLSDPLKADSQIHVLQALSGG